jgi:three-Cys-motif partner protein
MEDKIVTASDGLPALVFGRWSEEKLGHLREYCITFNKATHKNWENRVYIDLFCGPGKCLITNSNKEIDGSPLLALNCPIPFTHYFFNDLNTNFIEVLKERTKGYRGIRYLNSDCNDAVDEILREIPQDSICFAYIDPRYLAIRFDTIKKLTSGRAVDLLITFQIGMEKRNFLQPNLEMRQFFPPEMDWQQFQANVAIGEHISERIVLDAYENGLVQLGYPRDNIFDPVPEKNSGNALLYYLIFASKHPLGKLLYSGVINRKDSPHRKMI